MLLILLNFNVSLNVIKDEWLGNIFAIAYNPVRYQTILKAYEALRGYDDFLGGWGGRGVQDVNRKIPVLKKAILK